MAHSLTKAGAEQHGYPQGEGRERKTRSCRREIALRRHIAAKDKRQLRLLAASEGRRVNDYYIEAVNDFLEKHADRLPKL
ncbi:hypothetical protein NKH81_14325 [Mesorhizobium sp. M0959]|uniref:hypothetical protein n=1 Tax=Mesorhizobium sp. M0959 TaxID=2957034 RepID=UPI003337C863